MCATWTATTAAGTRAAVAPSCSRPCRVASNVTRADDCQTATATATITTTAAAIPRSTRRCSRSNLCRCVPPRIRIGIAPSATLSLVSASGRKWTLDGQRTWRGAVTDQLTKHVEAPDTARQMCRSMPRHAWQECPRRRSALRIGFSSDQHVGRRSDCKNANHTRS